MLMAPFLAVVMALVIAGAVVMVLPLSQPNESKASLTSMGIGGAQSTAAPQAAACAADLYFLPSIIALVAVGIIVGLAVVLLFFRREPK
jgi:hypothetical protein